MAHPQGLTPATLAIVAIALVLAAFPQAAVALEYDAARVVREPWRAITAQLVHWSPRMLAGDLLLLGIAGVIVERRSRRLWWLAILSGTAATAVALPLATDLARYRGSSGIGTALLVAGALNVALGPAGRSARLAAAAALAVVVLKVVLEATGAGVGGATNLPAGVVPATAVHFAGIAAGSLAYGIRARARGARR